MSIGTKNLTIPIIKEKLGETTDNFRSLCQSANRNKWGVNRKYVWQTTAINRFVELGTYNFRARDWRGYNHTQGPPSFIPLSSGSSSQPDYSSPSSWGMVQWGYRSFGNYTLTTDVGWITLKPIGEYNHFALISSEGHLYGGVDDASYPPYDIQYHSLDGSVSIQWTENTSGSSRTGHVYLTTPDDGDADITNVNRRLTIFQSGQHFLS